MAHNAAFDMRFLQLRADPPGLRFDQPVLTALLLSAVIHPQQESHRLETIAERLGVTILGRHTALGDAWSHRGVPEDDPAAAGSGHQHTGAGAQRRQKTYLARVTY